MNELIEQPTSTAIALALPPLAAKEKEIREQLHDLRNIAITTQDDANTVGETLAAGKKLGKELEDKRTAIKAPYLEASQAIDGHFKGIKEALDSHKKLCDSMLTAWDAKQREIARQEQAKRDAEAAQARERLRLQAEKQARIAQEAEAQAAKAETPEQAQAAVEAAQTARENASLLADTAAMTVSAPVRTQVLSQSSVYESWTAEVTDAAVAIAFIASRPDLHYLLMIDDRVLRNQAKTLKEALKIDGVRVWNKGSVRSLAKKAA